MIDDVQMTSSLKTTGFKWLLIEFYCIFNHYSNRTLDGSIKKSILRGANSKKFENNFVFGSELFFYERFAFNCLVDYC